MDNYRSLDSLKLSDHELNNVFFTDGRPDRLSKPMVMEQIFRRMLKREPTFSTET